MSDGIENLKRDYAEGGLAEVFRGGPVRWYVVYGPAPILAIVGASVFVWLVLRGLKK